MLEQPGRDRSAEKEITFTHEDAIRRFEEMKALPNTKEDRKNEIDAEIARLRAEQAEKEKSG